MVEIFVYWSYLTIFSAQFVTCQISRVNRFQVCLFLTDINLLKNGQIIFIEGKIKRTQTEQFKQ